MSYPRARIGAGQGHDGEAGRRDLAPQAHVAQHPVVEPGQKRAVAALAQVSCQDPFSGWAALPGWAAFGGARAAEGEEAAKQR